VKRY